MGLIIEQIVNEHRTAVHRATRQARENERLRCVRLLQELGQECQARGGDRNITIGQALRRMAEVIRVTGEE